MLDTLENVKERLGITSSEHDNFLTSQITLISDVIEAYCRRKFLEADYIQTFYNTDHAVTQVLDLYYFPVTEIDSIEEDDVVLDSSSYRLNTPRGKIYRTEGSFFCSTETVITYTAGYASCPTPVLSVLDSLVQERYNKKTSGIDLNFGSDVQRISIPGAISIDFDYTLSNNERKNTYGSILGSHMNILDDYRSDRSVLPSSKPVYIEVDAP